LNAGAAFLDAVRKPTQSTRSAISSAAINPEFLRRMLHPCRSMEAHG
jgi:hypothetical protein